MGNLATADLKKLVEKLSGCSHLEFVFSYIFLFISLGLYSLVYLHFDLCIGLLKKDIPDEEELQRKNCMLKNELHHISSNVNLKYTN